MKHIGLLTAAAALLCVLSACNTTKDPGQSEQPSMDYETVDMQTGADYHSSMLTGISKDAACKNAAVADWIALCAQPERDDIGHYVLHNKQDNGDGTFTHHLLLYRSATEKDLRHFTVTFTMQENTLTVTPTYTSADTSLYGYDLIYVTLRTEGDPELSVELLVDGDYPGQIQSTTQSAITPDTFGINAHE